MRGFDGGLQIPYLDLARQDLACEQDSSPTSSLVSEILLTPVTM